MDKLKDIFYDKNDILVAIVILLIAGVVISWRMNVIMAFPETLVANSGTSVQEPNTPDDPADPIPPADKQTPIGDDNSAVSGAGTTGAGTTEPEMLSVYINYGESMNTIAGKFVDVGLFKSKDQFITLVNQTGAATKLRAGNFVIPANATPDEVIGYLVKGGI